MEKIKGLSLFQKTGLLAFCLFGIISVMASGLVAWTLYSRMTEEYVSKGSAISAAIARGSQEILLVRDAATIQSMVDQYLEIEGVAYVFVMDDERQVIAHTLVPEMPRPLLELVHSEMGWIREFEIDGLGRVIDVCKPVLAGVAGYVHVGMDKGVIMGYFWEAILRMQAMISVCFWVCVGILYVITRRISRPLHQLAEHAQKLKDHDFSATIDIHTHDELELLGRTMQSMGQELSLLFSEMESEVDKASGELREHMVYLASIIDNLVDGLLVVNPLGVVSVVNPAMRAYFDLDDSPLEKRSVADVFPAEVVALATDVRQCPKGVLSSEIPLSKGRTGKAVASPILTDGEGSKCLGGVILIRDITREKELDRLKTDFISTVSHELRTPMTSVLGFSKIIRKKLDRKVFPLAVDHPEAERPIAQIRENLGIIVSEAERLTELINDVLDIARMEAGKVQWSRRRISMADVIIHSRDSTRGLWESKGLVLELDIQDGLAPIDGDFDRLVQVVVNLVSNAVKFTTVSPIVCRARGKDGMVEVSVADKGAGIAEEDLEHVFDRFKQVGDTLTSKPAGTGLGLPICRQIVEHHGGCIWAESQLGRGSTFIFSIPTADAPDVTPPMDRGASGGQEVTAKSRSFRSGAPLILFVGDDVRRLGEIAAALRESGCRVEHVRNSMEAESRAKALGPDLIVMDILFPGMDGNELVSALRASLSTRSTPILILPIVSGQTQMGPAPQAGGDHARGMARLAMGLIRRRALHTDCLLIGVPGRCDLDELVGLCTGEVIFAPMETVQNRLAKGFTGVVFVPTEEVGGVPLRQLAEGIGTSVVVLPGGGCQ